jgi:hypothetical protein
MGKAYEAPLHERAHWRRIREVIAEIATYERFNINDYDLLRITAYDTEGENQKGKNVSYNVEHNLSCWVLDNRYDMFEVPHKSNKPGSPYGKFLFFAYNTSFKYYQFGELVITLDASESRRTKFVTEKVIYSPYGKYDIVFQGSKNNITKQEFGYNYAPGLPSSEHNFSFDSYNARKTAYKTDSYKILKTLGVVTTGLTKVIDKGRVKIYGKNKKKPVKKTSAPSKPRNTNKLKSGNKPGNRNKAR